MNNINTLRDHLFDAIKKVKDGSLSVEQGKCVSELSQTIINSAKLEFDYERHTDQSIDNKFINPPRNGRVVHKIAG